MLTERRFAYWHPLRLDRTLLGGMGAVFIGANCFILFILLMFQALRLAEFLIVKGAPPHLLASMTLSLLISFLPTSLPISFLIAVLMTFSRLSAQSELIALRACGWSVWRLSVPFLLASLGISAVSWHLGANWVPRNIAHFKSTQIKVAHSRATAAISEGAFTTGFFDLVVFAEKVDHFRNTLHRVFIYDERQPTQPLTYVAQSATLEAIKAPDDASTAIHLKLRDGSMHHQNLADQSVARIQFAQYDLILRLGEGVGRALAPHTSDQRTLERRLAELGSHTPEGRNYAIEYWRRNASALAPIIFTFLGVGLGTVNPRSSRSGSMLLGLLILILYWVLQTWATNQIITRQWVAWLTMELPNLVILSLSVPLYWRALR